MVLTHAQRTVKENSTFQYTATLKDETGTVIPLSGVTTFTLTLYDLALGSIINTKDGTDILNANNGTIHATSGLFTWVAKPADNIIVGAGTDILVGKTEEHVALFEWTYNSGLDSGRQELHIYVEQLAKVP